MKATGIWEVPLTRWDHDCDGLGKASDNKARYWLFDGSNYTKAWISLADDGLGSLRDGYRGIEGRMMMGLWQSTDHEDGKVVMQEIGEWVRFGGRNGSPIALSQ
jgi:hypothetical protein